jgi:23S rRNA (adenine2030-N6)-methyltransferase
MNYKHIYHAGNFADVAKHVALLYCLEALRRKEAAFFVLDTHAGRGIYDLKAVEAKKSGEAEAGVQRAIEALADGHAQTGGRTHAADPVSAGSRPPIKLESDPARAESPEGSGEPSLASYFSAIGARPGKRLARYPGSPALIASSLRSQDRAIMVELIPAEARAIAREIHSAGRLRAEAGDGYAALKAHLPPPERRGLVLIDPPYESEDELRVLLEAFSEAYRRWPTGMYLVWYPILSAVQRQRVHARFSALRIPKMLHADLAVHPDDAGVGLAGSGLIIVNPPYGTDEYLAGAYSALHGALAKPGQGYAEVARLTPERMAQ